MFGYMRPEISELKVREYNSFRAHYCGVCHAMKRYGGRHSSLALSYDATLLALTGALYRPGDIAQGRCIGNSLRRVMLQTGEATDYAADINLLYAHLKCQDDVADEGSLKGRVGEWLLRKAAAQVAGRRPDLAKATQVRLADLAEMERERCDQPDLPASASGQALAEAFAALPGGKRDEEALRWLGLHVGRFVYFCDAIEDAEQDAKEGGYNVLLQAYHSPGALTEHRGELEMLLYYSIGEAEKAITLLPERPIKTLIHNIAVLHAARLAEQLLSGRTAEKPQKGWAHQSIPRTLL